MDYSNILAKLEDNRSYDKNDRVLLIDGLNLFIRVWASIPVISNGEHVGGIVGFLRSLTKEIREYNPSRCVVVFDGKGGSLRRRKLYPEYKNNRINSHTLRRDFFSTKEEEQASMKVQLQRVVEYLNLLPVQVVCVDYIEADDAIAYLTKQYFTKKIRIVSTDRDFLQLVDERIEVYSPVKKKLYTIQTLEEEYGIKHTNFLLYRMIEGDNSDNILGVNGIGLKTFRKYFPEVSEDDLTFESIIETSKNKLISDKKPNKIFKTITEHHNELHRNYKLMQLSDVDISVDSKQRIRGIVDSDIPVLNQLKFRQLLAQDYLLESFKYLDSWLYTYNGLNIWKIR